MSAVSLRARLPAVNGWLLAAMCFALATHAAPVYVLSFFILVLWLLQPALGARIGDLLRTPVVWAFVAYYAVFALSLLWTQDTAWGERMVGRQTPFLLFPLFWSVAQGSNRRHCLSAFLAAIGVCVMLAYYNWLQMHVFTDWPIGIRVEKSLEDTAPFVDRIMYAPLLAFAGYFVGYRLLFERAGAAWRVIYAVFLVAIVANLVFSGGRAGLVGFLALLLTLVMQRYAHRPLRAAVVGLALVASIVGAGYAGNAEFRARFDMAVEQVRDPAANINTSVGLRINYAAHSLRMFAAQPWGGVGVGDFTNEYTTINERLTPHAGKTFNPHNQYLWILTTTGLLGAAVAAWMIGAMAAGWRKRDRESNHLLVALLIGFGTICLFESYLWRSNTALFFVAMSALALTPQRRDDSRGWR